MRPAPIDMPTPPDAMRPASFNMRTPFIAMRTMLFAAILACLATVSFGQSVTYDIPAGLEHDMSPDHYHFLVDTSIAVVAERFQIEFVKGGTIQLVKGQELAALNLDNLILKCSSVADTTAWPAIIRDHFNKVFNSVDQREKLDITNYFMVKSYLTLRIYPQLDIDQRGGTAALVSRTDLEGTYTVLMLDLPGAFTPVQKKDFEHWNRAEAEVFRVAQDNVDSQKVDKVTKTSDLGGTPIQVTVLGNDDYAASYALDLGRNSPELIGDWGCAIAMPDKGLVTLCKISHDKPLDFVKYIQLTKDYMERAFQEDPHHISDQFFWYYKETFTPIRVETDGAGNINVISPYGLTKLMADYRLNHRSGS